MGNDAIHSPGGDGQVPWGWKGRTKAPWESPPAINIPIAQSFEYITWALFNLWYFLTPCLQPCLQESNNFVFSLFFVLLGFHRRFYSGNVPKNHCTWSLLLLPPMLEYLRLRGCSSEPCRCAVCTAKLAIHAFLQSGKAFPLFYNPANQLKSLAWAQL